MNSQFFKQYGKILVRLFLVLAILLVLVAYGTFYLQQEIIDLELVIYQLDLENNQQSDLYWAYRSDLLNKQYLHGLAQNLLISIFEMIFSFFFFTLLWDRYRDDMQSKREAEQEAFKRQQEELQKQSKIANVVLVTQPQIFLDEIRRAGWHENSLDGVNWSGLTLEARKNARELEGFRLNKAIMRYTTLNDINMVEVELIDSDLQHSQLRSADLSFAKLARANLQDCDLTKASLFKAELQSAKLNNSVLAGASLASTNLTHASLESANLEGADLSNANLQNADLRRVNLKGANLTNADLRGVRLFKTDISGADLSNAKVYDNFEIHNLITDDNTILKTSVIKS